MERSHVDNFIDIHLYLNLTNLSKSVVAAQLLRILISFNIGAADRRE